MKYHIAKKQNALDKNHQEALNRGCGLTTQYWWSMIYSNDNTEIALRIPEEDVPEPMPKDQVEDVLPDRFKNEETI